MRDDFGNTEMAAWDFCALFQMWNQKGMCFSFDGFCRDNCMEPFSLEACYLNLSFVPSLEPMLQEAS